MLEDQGEYNYLVLEDLNLYYSVWSGTRLAIAHTAAEKLIEVIYKWGECQLIMPPGTITFSTTLGGTIINLAFGLDKLINRALECRIAHKLNHGSDYLPVLLQF